MFLTLEKFLEHFPPIKLSRSQFIKKLIITYSPPLTLEQALNPKPSKIIYRGKTILKTLIKSKNDIRYLHRTELIDYLYQMAITHRLFYLAKHFQSYFYFPNPFSLKWNSQIDLHLPDNMIPVQDREPKWAGNLSLQKNDASRRIVRNLFYLELLHLTQATNSVKSLVSYWHALDNFYNHLKLEDRLMSPSSVKLFIRPKGNLKEEKNVPAPPKNFTGFNRNLNYHNFFYQLQAYQGKASIINPYFIHWCLENLFNTTKTGKKMLTPVLSWGSYLIAFMHTIGWDHYVGIDVMPSICKKVEFLAKYYQGLPEMKGITKKVDIYCKPSESFLKDPNFLKKYKSYFDLVLVCPPYFDMELYHEGQQSTESYPDYDQWLEKYWYQTVKMCFHTMKKGSTFAMILNDYSTLKGKYYPLIKDMTKIVEKTGLKYEKYFYLFNRTSPLRMNKKMRTERLIIFKKL